MPQLDSCSLANRQLLSFTCGQRLPVSRQRRNMRAQRDWHPGEVLMRLLQKILIEGSVAEVGTLEHCLLRAAALDHFC
jgi:hypothetical protein